MDDKERYRILKKHGFLPGRYVILRSYTDTKNRGWLSPREKKPDNLIGKRGIIESVHENVIEAVKVYFEKEGDRRYWSYKDLMMAEIEEPEPRIFHFDISLLNTGV